MANVHLQFQSFNAGELSPLLGARFAVEKVASGCRRLRNFYTHVHGPAFRRPGMEHMGAAASDAERSRLEGFNFSTSTGFVLEFAPSGLNVWSNSVEVPLRSGVALPYNAQECAELQLVQVNDVCYIAHPNHQPRKLVRYADDDWRLMEIDWGWPAMGDENVRSEEIATPAVTELLSIGAHKWPEFTMSAGAYTFETDGTVTSPSGSKVGRLQRLNGTEWQTLKTLTWGGTTPTPQGGTLGPAGNTLRITYDGPALASGASIHVERGLEVHSLPLDVKQPRDAEEVTVPAKKEWLVSVDLLGFTVDTASRVQVLHFFDGQWRVLKVITPKNDEVITWRGPQFGVDRLVMLNWTGPAASGGEMRIDQLDYPPSTTITVAVNATSGEDRTMTASEPIFTAGHVGSFWQIVHQRAAAFAQIVADEPTITAETSTSVRVSGRWDLFTYGTWDATLYLEKKINSIWEVARSWTSKKDRNIIASGVETEEVELRLRVSAGTSDAATGAAVPRFILELSDSRVAGVVRIKAVGALTDGKTDAATADVEKVLHSTDATALWTEGAWSDARGFPRAVAIYGQRLWFGGTAKEPQRLWGSVIADYENFRRTSLDDGSVSFVPAAQQANVIQWLAPHGEEMIIGTSGDEWTLGPAPNGAGIVTPVSAVMQRRSAYGSAQIAPLLLGEGLVFVQRGAQKLRQISARAEAVAWAATNLSVLAEHATKTGIIQMAAMTFPLTILWAVTADGKLLGMTFESEQNVFGWHVHETSGTVESVAVVHGIETDEVWLAVLREGKRYIERLDPLVFAQDFEQRARLIYLDAAMRVESATDLSEVTGLAHLEGRTVGILADGAELEEQQVANGTVTLSTVARTVVVGLPFTSELQPMRVDIPMRDGTAQGRNFRVSRVMLALHSSLGGEVADSPTSRFQKLNYRRVASEVGSPPPLYTGEIETAVDSNARSGVDVMIKATGPLPFNVGGFVAKLDIYGE